MEGRKEGGRCIYTHMHPVCMCAGIGNSTYGGFKKGVWGGVA